MANELKLTPPAQGALTDFDESYVRERFRRLEKDTLFFDAHQAEWRKQYPDMYVAVYRGELVCVAATAEELVSSLRAKSIPREESCCRFLSSKRMTLAPSNRMLPLH